MQGSLLYLSLDIWWHISYRKTKKNIHNDKQNGNVAFGRTTRRFLEVSWAKWCELKWVLLSTASLFLLTAVNTRGFWFTAVTGLLRIRYNWKIMIGRFWQDKNWFSIQRRILEWHRDAGLATENVSHAGNATSLDEPLAPGESEL